MGGFYERDLNSPSQIMQGIEFYPHIVNPKLRNLIHFSTSDLRKASKEQDFSNQVVSFRNGWVFNTLEEQDEISKNLYKNSNSKTLIIIGQSDLFKSNASDALQRNGFKGIESEVFAGGETDYPSDLIGTPKTPAEFEKFIKKKKEVYMCSLSVPTTILKTLETSSSIGMLARDTGGCLISRLGLSRSMDEAKEISFAEIYESVLFLFFSTRSCKSKLRHLCQTSWNYNRTACRADEKC